MGHWRVSYQITLCYRSFLNDYRLLIKQQKRQTRSSVPMPGFRVNSGILHRSAALSLTLLSEIDQVFSKVGVALRQTDTPTRSILETHIVRSYDNNVSSFLVRISHLYHCTNVRDLLQGRMFVVPSITSPQAFRASKDPADNKKVTFQM